MEDRITEQDSAYDDLQRMSVHDILTGINREDARVHEAVAKTIPVMERLVERVVERMERGGRMFYIGAGTSGRLGVTDASELPPTYGVPFDRVIGLIAGGDGALRRAVENAEDDTAGAWRDMAPYHPTAGDVLIGIAASGTPPSVIGGLRAARREPKRIRFVRHRAGSSVNLVLIESRLGGRPGLQYEPDLFLYEQTGELSAEGRRIYHLQE